MLKLKPASLAAIYFVFGMLWILLSDELMALAFRASPDLLILVSKMKGTLFILCTTLLLYGLLRQYERSRRIQDQALRESEETFRKLFEGSPDPILLMRGERFIECNQAALQLLETDDRDRLVGATAFDFSPALQSDGRSSREAGLGFIARAWEEGISRFEWQCTTFKDHLLIIEVSLLPITVHGERLLHNTWRDVTLRKRAEDALRQSHDALEKVVARRTKDLQQANDKLRQLDELRRAFLSFASHELRTPLTSVLGFAALAVKSVTRHIVPALAHNPVAMQRAQTLLANLQVIESEGRRLARLVDDLLDLSKIESEQYAWNDTRLRLGDVVQAAVATIQGELAARPELRLELILDPDAPAMLADHDRMLQVFLNLLGNALKFTPAGFIRVTVHPASDGGLEARVEDSGRGIPPGDLERIFERFYQTGHADTAAHPKGTGLGLAICRQIVEHYGGHIRAESMPGKGAAFIMRWPANAQCLVA
ncbi:PAS domain-containing sensor histidine kinase [Megalodesulfovibrio gigas]|nr:PAS domain-containing sensor histidine kinase [Megalodesulfovibrio gigas]